MTELSEPATPAETSPDNLSFRALLRGTPPLVVAGMVLAIRSIMAY